MVRIVNHSQRRNSILNASINAYINSASPVSSEFLAREFDLSSATVRHIFAELEEAGYLTHPHTSAGRVPTDKGYRYYVDFLMAEHELLEEEKKKIINEYKTRLEHLEDILEKTSEVISAITHYAGIVAFAQEQNKFFYRGLSRILQQPEFSSAEKICLLIKVIEEKRRLLDIINRDFEEEKTKIYIGDEIGCTEISGCSLVVSTCRRGKRNNAKVAVLGPRRMNYDHIIPALEFIADTLSDSLID